MSRYLPWLVLLTGSDEISHESAQAEERKSLPAAAWALAVAGEAVSPARTVMILRTEEGALMRLPASLAPEESALLPSRRGTGVYLLAALFSILARDPRARIVVLEITGARAPGHHLRAPLQDALQSLAAGPQHVVLVGSRPRTCDPSRGWIIPSSEPTSQRARKVAAFIEKPDLMTARQLHAGGALVSVGAFAALGRTLLDLYAAVTPRLVRQFMRWRGEKPAANLASHLDAIPPCDFNREVLEWAHGSLAVVPLAERSTPRPGLSDAHGRFRREEWPRQELAR